MDAARPATTSERIREQLDHPVIDGDGHVIELVPVFAEFVRDHGRSDLVDTMPMFGLVRTGHGLTPMTVDERRAAGVVPAAWTTPTDTDYFATITTASRYYDRIGEAGIDFAVLYPTLGLPLMQIDEPDERVAICRLFNEFMAEQYAPFGDRFTMAAAVPMHSPDEAIAGLEHAKALGAKVVLIPSYVRRARPDESWGSGHEHVRASGFGNRGWLDTFGLDSAYDYDPVWAKAIELGLPLAVHSPGMGFSDRQSPSSFSYNGVGHFAAAGTALAKSLFFGGVIRRFPELRVAVLEGGVATGVETYVRLMGFWKKRGTPGIDTLNPARIDKQRLHQLWAESGSPAADLPIDLLVRQLGDPDGRVDDFEAAGITSTDDIAEQFCRAFYWGCEADDPLVGMAFDDRITGGHRVPAIMGSDIGHWDVTHFDSPLAEAYELVELGILDDAQLRDYLFTHSVELYASLNADFFTGTTVEAEAAAVLKARASR